MLSKKQARAQLRAARSDRALPHRATCSRLTVFLANAVPKSMRVVVYDALPDELNLESLIASDPDPESRFAVTRTPETSMELSVHPWGCETERHRYGYDQPRADAPSVPDSSIGAVLVPALGFDRSGTRLGRGKGYYDRFLARLSSDTLFIGMTGDYLAETLPADSFDVSMTHLAFSSGVEPVPLVRSI